MSYDFQIASYIQQVMASSPFLLALAVFLARWLIFVFIFLFIFLWQSKQSVKRHAVLEGVWAVGLTLLITALIAFFVQRARPFLADFEIGTITRLIPIPYNTSFPSGHTGTAVAMALAIFSVHKRLGILALFMALLVAVGRIAVGVHYPTDILGGFLVGSSAFVAVRFFHHRLRRRDILISARHHHHT